MIHLDRNHSSAIAPQSKPNLIHNTSSHPDQHNALFRSSPGHDDTTVYSKEAPTNNSSIFPPDTGANPAEPSSNSAPSNLPPAVSGETLNGPVAEPSQNNAAELRSPALDTNSSLTPPPEGTSPTSPSHTLHPVNASPAKIGGDLPQENNFSTTADGLDRISRASTPLSELSSAPDVASPATVEKSGANGETPENNTTGNVQLTTVKSSSTDPNVKKEEADKSANTSVSQASQPSDQSSQPNGTRPSLAQSSVKQSDIASGNVPVAQQGTPHLKSAVASNETKAVDSKVYIILELNTHLLKVFMALQARQIPLTDPRCQAYSVRLQTNLHWLASAADERQRNTLGTMPLPHMDPPPPVDFFPVNDKIQQLYTELQTIFAKDIARRRAAAGPQSMLSNGSLKRGPSDDVSQGHAMKRQHTGDTKISAPIPSTVPVGGPVVGHRSSSIPPQSPHPSQGPTPRPMHGVGSPSMPPPPVPPGAMATSDVRVRASSLPGATGITHMSQSADGARHMSPTVPQNAAMPMAGPSSGHSQATQAAVSQLGHGAFQWLQILQNPLHPVMQHINQTIHNFNAYPIQQQLQRVQATYMALRNHEMQQHQQRMAGNMQPQGGTGMVGFGMRGTGMPASPMANGSPTRASPVSQHSPMGAQPGMGSFSPSNPTMGSGFDSRSIMSALNPQQQAQLQNMPQQQRQLLLMQMQQQQQLMRGANAGQVNNHQLSVQQRMAQSSSTGQGGISMGMNPMDANVIPALRSNPGMPGIARSARTPSDHAPSPLAPQMGQRDYQRAMLTQQQQQAQRGMSNPMANTGGPQLGGMPNPSFQQQMGSQINPQIPLSQDSYGMSRPGSAGQGAFSGGMDGVNPSLLNQNWNQMNGGGGQFSLGMDSSGLQTSPPPNLPQHMGAGSPVVQNGVNDFNAFWPQ